MREFPSRNFRSKPNLFQALFVGWQFVLSGAKGYAEDHQLVHFNDGVPDQYWCKKAKTR